jgi:NADH-quinone oxidoreductase subunit M
MVKEFGGLAKVMPVYAVVFITVTLSSIGVPGTNGFVGEFMVIIGTFMSDHLGNFAHIQGTLAAIGVILAAVYMLSVVQKMFFGPLSNEKNKGLTDMNVREVIAVAPMMAMIFVIGFFPKIFLQPMEPTVDAVLDRYRVQRQEFIAQEQGAPARLLGRRGGPLELGYPTAPQAEVEKGAVAEAPEPEVGEAAQEEGAR